MKRTIVLGLLAFLGSQPAAAEGQLEWLRTHVSVKLDKEGGVRVEETHEVAVTGDVSYVYRTLLTGVDQTVVIHSVVMTDLLGSRTALRNAPDGPDSYQAWGWGLQIWLKAEADPPIEPRARRNYTIEYTLRGAVTPSWDLAAGVEPLDSGTMPRNPLDRAREVLAGFQAAWPDLRRVYRFDHDVEFPTRGTPNALSELNYRFEYDPAWVLLDKDRDIGVATPEVDYRVKRHLRYLPEGEPKEVDPQAAALRIAGAFGPFALCLMMLALFLGSNRLLAAPPHGDRELFERIIEPLPKEMVAARYGDAPYSPSFEELMKRMAAHRKISIGIEKAATDETDAVVSMRLTVPRDRLNGLERKIVDELFGHADTVTTRDIQERFRGQEFDPNDLIERAFSPLAPKPAPTRGRVFWVGLAIASFAGGAALIVKCLIDQTLKDPAPIVAGFIPGQIFSIFWPIGSASRRVSTFTLVLAAILFSALGTALALSPNTPLTGFAALGLGLMTAGHYAGYLARLPNPRPEDLEFEAARSWATSELKKPRPALKDAWVEALEAMGLKAAIEKSKQRSGDFGAAPDMADLGLGEMQSGPPFTGEAPRPPALPGGWSEGFYLFEDEDD